MFPVILCIYPCSTILPTGVQFLKRPMSANPGLKFCSSIAFYLEYLSSCCVVLTGSQSNSTTILDILCSHYFFVDERPKYKICLILELNQLKHPSRNLASYSRVFPFPSSCSLLTYIFLINSIWISPVPFYIYPLLPCIVFVFPYIPVPF